jgi:hypothetical protein
LLPESQARLSETGNTSMSEQPVKDDSEMSQGRERDKLLEDSTPDAFVTERRNDDYFVLQETDDMDLK